VLLQITTKIILPLFQGVLVYGVIWDFSHLDLVQWP
jgi:hypothetical protein